MKSKRIMPADRFKDVPLFMVASGITTIEEEKIEKEPKPKKQKPNQVTEKDLTQCCFRIQNYQFKALGTRHIETRENISNMVREALGMYLSDYLEDKTVNLCLSATSSKTPEDRIESVYFYLNQELINAIRIVAANNAVEKSVIVRNAIDQYLMLKDAK